jgi:hypothetical protein
MEAKDLIFKSLEQSQGYLTKALDGLTEDEAAWSPGTECNCIAFILWHTTRAEDLFVDQLIQQKDQLYEAEGWREKAPRRTLRVRVGMRLASSMNRKPRATIAFIRIPWFQVNPPSPSGL